MQDMKRQNVSYKAIKKKCSKNSVIEGYFLKITTMLHYITEYLRI